MKNKTLLLSIAIVAIFGFLGLKMYSKYFQKPVSVTMVEPMFVENLFDANDKMEIGGKEATQILHVFSVKCKSCTEKMTELSVLFKKHNAKVIGAVLQTNKDDAQNVLTPLKEINDSPVSAYTKIVVLSPENVVNLGISDLPVTIIIQDGKIVFSEKGHIDEKALHFAESLSAKK